MNSLSFTNEEQTYHSAEAVSRPVVEAALLVHGVLKARQLRLSWPVVAEWVITEAVVGTADTNRGRDTKLG